MNMKKILGILVVLGLLGAGGWYFVDKGRKAAEEVTEESAEAVPVDTGVDIVAAEGRIVPLHHAGISFQMPGSVSQILVEEGDTVSEGDVLIQLSATELEAAVSQAEAGLAQAQTVVTAAKTQMEAAEGQRVSAELAVASAEAQYALTTANPTETELAVYQAQIAAGQGGISQAVGNRDASYNVNDSQLQSAQANLAAAQAQERAAQAAYDDVIRYEIHGSPEEQVNLALAAARANLAAAQSAVNELQNGPTDAQRLAAGGAVSAAVAQRDLSQAQLDLFVEGAKPEQVALAQIGIDQSKAALSQAVIGVGQAQDGITQAEAGVQQAQAGLEAAQASLGRMTLTAPFDGTIASIDVELGDVVGAGMPILSLADFSQWLIETTDLTELDVVAIGNGFPVEISIDAIPDEEVAGTVTDIADVSQLVQGDVTYKTTIAIDDSGTLPLRWGMTVFVRILTE